LTISNLGLKAVSSSASISRLKVFFLVLRKKRFSKRVKEALKPYQMAAISPLELPTVFLWYHLQSMGLQPLTMSNPNRYWPKNIPQDHMKISESKDN
jgi:hypothetical protein